MGLLVNLPSFKKTENSDRFEELRAKKANVKYIGFPEHYIHELQLVLLKLPFRCERWSILEGGICDLNSKTVLSVLCAIIRI